MAFEEALGRAYRFLGHRDRTCAEIEKHLVRAGEEPVVAHAVVEELKTQGYLNDARFAKAFAGDRRKLDGWSSGRIHARLTQLGIAEELAQESVSSAGIGGDVEAAVALLHARVRKVPTDPRARNRAFGVLARRGYEAEVAYDALRRFERGANL